jgi:hypothetical protein
LDHRAEYQGQWRDDMKRCRNRGSAGQDDGPKNLETGQSATVDAPPAMALVYAERLRAWQNTMPIPFPTLDQNDEMLRLKPGLKA